MRGRDRLRELLAGGRETPVLVAGDIIADRYVWGSSGRVSREAPVLILRYQEERILAGGAANAAMNLRSLGAPVALVGVVGDDGPGRRVVEILSGEGVDVSGVVTSGDRGSTVKTRIMAGDVHSCRQQVLRVDRDQPDQVEEAVEQELVGRARELMAGARGLLLSDYGQGVLGGRLREAAIENARARGMVTCADSRRRLEAFVGVTTATPNVTEALPAVPPDARGSVDRVGRYLLDLLRADSVIITRGSAGMRVISRGEEAVDVGVVGGVEVIDVTGAGDTVASVVTLALAAGGSPMEAAVLATHAAGVVVTKRGTAAATTEEVERSLAERWEQL